MEGGEGQSLVENTGRPGDFQSEKFHPSDRVGLSHTCHFFPFQGDVLLEKVRPRLRAREEWSLYLRPIRVSS